MTVQGDMMPDPARGADIGDPFLLIAVKMRPDMLEQMIRHGYQSSTSSRLFWRGECSVGGGAGVCMTA